MGGLRALRWPARFEKTGSRSWSIVSIRFRRCVLFWVSWKIRTSCLRMPKRAMPGWNKPRVCSGFGTTNRSVGLTSTSGTARGTRRQERPSPELPVWPGRRGSLVRRGNLVRRESRAATGSMARTAATEKMAFPAVMAATGRLAKMGSPARKGQWGLPARKGNPE